MKKATKFFLIGLSLVVVILVGVSCTQNQRARQFGGTATVNLPLGKKLVVVTWKEDDSLWYLIRPMRSDETPESYQFQEDSSFGIFEGTVIIQEHAAK